VLKFANIVSDGRPEVAAERLEEYLSEHYARDIRRDAFGED